MYLQGTDRLEHLSLAEELEMYNAEFELFHPRKVCISMKQGEGAAARPVVSVGEHVACGQLIGKNTSQLSLPVYASVSGTVVKIWEKQMSVYEVVSHIVIEADHFPDGSVPKMLELEKNPLYSLKKMGIIGMLHKRRPLFLSGLYMGKVKELCLAAFDREPLVYSDYRLIMECPAKVLFGARMLAEIYHFDTVSIYVCHDEIRYLLEKTAKTYSHALLPLANIRFYTVPESMYKKSCTPLKKVEYGLWCSAVELCAVYDGFYDSRPMTGRGLTVSGKVKHRKNLWVPNGTYVRDLLEFCGGIAKEKAYVNSALIQQQRLCVVEGGPLKGHCVDVDHACVSLTTESLLVLECEILEHREEECLLCRDCCFVCPVGLKPLHIEKALREEPCLCSLLDADLCVECGWCSYVCPAHRHLKERVAAAKKLPVRPKAPAAAAEGGPEKKDGAKLVKGTQRHGSPKAYAMEAAAEPWDYIDLDISDADTFEPLIPVSQSGPYIHGGRSVSQIMGKWLVVSFFMCSIYSFVFGPLVWIRAGAAAFLFAALKLAVRLWQGRMQGCMYGHIQGRAGLAEFFGPKSLLWKEALVDGAMTGMALSFIPSWKWLVLSVIVSYAAGRAVRVNSLLAGITLSLCAYSFVNPGSGPYSLWIALGWMAVWVYMIYEMLILPWATIFFLLVFEWFAVILGGHLLWTPMAFMGAVWFMNDYKNGGKDTPMQRLLAVFAGAVSGILAVIFPVGAGVCLGLLIVNIIACNLMSYTI